MVHSFRRDRRHGVQQRLDEICSAEVPAAVLTARLPSISRPMQSPAQRAMWRSSHPCTTGRAPGRRSRLTSGVENDGRSTERECPVHGVASSCYRIYCSQTPRWMSTNQMAGRCLSVNARPNRVDSVVTPVQGQFSPPRSHLGPTPIMNIMSSTLSRRWGHPARAPVVPAGVLGSRGLGIGHLPGLGRRPAGTNDRDGALDRMHLDRGQTK